MYNFAELYINFLMKHLVTLLIIFAFSTCIFAQDAAIAAQDTTTSMQDTVVSVQTAQVEEAYRPKVGLALSGGGAKGAACIGALKYIEKAGIKIDYIAGTSAGAIIGAFYSLGYSAEEIDSLYRAQDWLMLLSDRDEEMRKIPLKIDKEDESAYVFGFPAFSRKEKPFDRGHGMMSGDSIVIKFEKLFNQPDSINFDELPIPFRCVSVDINEFQEHVFSSGNLAVAVRASMSVPIAFRTVELDGMSLVDGGLLNNMPADVVKSMGADYVIAIDLADSKRAKQKGVDKMKLHGLPGIIAWQVARPDLKKYHSNSKLADIVIHPDVKGYNGASFKPSDTKELIRRGEIAGESALPKLLKLKKKL